jgi:DNA helicase-2/ATP-dependent DNA helicase PcrA
MAQSRLTLEPEVQRILDKIDEGKNFLLSGGAGSGKTYSLVQTIRQALDERPTSTIACITYTNAAVHEISARVSHPHLRISTIHDFLWDVLKRFQKELKAVLIKLLNDEAHPRFKVEGTPVEASYFSHLGEGIQYKEFVRLKEGIISHDELLVVAEKMFQNYPKLGTILKSTFACIFVDEYQDTSKEVVRILLDHLPDSPPPTVIGFFGDSMQSIYDDTVGDLDVYTVAAPPKVYEIQKPQNRRNPLSVITLANRLRTDALAQVGSTDEDAPNMLDGTLKPGRILFLHSSSPDLQLARNYLEQTENWEIADARKTKELNLTHNLIADKAGFRELMDVYDKDRIIKLKGDVSKKLKEAAIEVPEGATFGDALKLSGIVVGGNNVVAQFVTQNPQLFDKAKAYNWISFRRLYVDRDQLIDDKKQDPDELAKKGSNRDALITHLFKIERLIELYSSGNFNAFLAQVEFPVTKVEDKRRLKEAIDQLQTSAAQTIDEVISLAHELGLCLIDDRIERFRIEAEYLYDRVKVLPYSQFRALFRYVEGHTPFSTQHKTKGREFKNVLVVMDNGKWNDYNFKTLFIGGGSESVLKRTQKIFYVCCTRAMDNLAVFYHEPIPAVIAKAREWFGAENVVELTNAPAQAQQ